MKRTITTLLCLAALVCGCTKPVEPEPEPSVDWKETYNGHLALCLADAYGQWERDDKLPAVIKWDGVSVFTAEYVRAGICLALQIIDKPEEWMKEDVTYPSATFSLTTDDPFIPQEVPFADFVKLLRVQYENMVGSHQVALNMQIPGYEPNLSTTGLAVMLCRAFAYFVDKESFPEKINTWEASYTHSSSNCDITSADVKTARDAAWAKAGVTESSSARDKAVAIFNYARDQWEWEDYYNTRKGAAGTIKAKGGNCCDLSHAVVAMARLSGIPARYFHAQCKFSSGYIGHVVSQLFVDGEWHMADASNNSNSFGTVVFNGYTGLHYYEDLPF